MICSNHFDIKCDIKHADNNSWIIIMKIKLIKIIMFTAALNSFQ